MMIIVKGVPKEGSTVIAAFLRSVLSSWGIPVDTKDHEDFEVLKLRVRRVADSLQTPIIIKTKTVRPKPGRWTDHLTIEDGQVIVKGTWVTVGQVISLIVDGSTWSDILRTHPELCEDDIRACLTYAIQEDILQGDDYVHCQENSGGSGEGDPRPPGEEVAGNRFPTGYVRITGRPFPVGPDGFYETFKSHGPIQ